MCHSPKRYMNYDGIRASKDCNAGESIKNVCCENSSDTDLIVKCINMLLKDTEMTFQNILILLFL